MKYDTACTESTRDHHYDNERRRSMYRVNSRPPLRQWKTTQHMQSQPQTNITIMKDDASCSEWIPDQHFDIERRHIMYKVNHNTPLRQWKTKQHVQSQSQTTITTMKDNATCTELIPDHHYYNERRRSMYRVNPRPPLRKWKRHSMYRVNPRAQLRQRKKT